MSTTGVNIKVNDKFTELLKHSLVFSIILVVHLVLMIANFTCINNFISSIKTFVTLDLSTASGTFNTLLIMITVFYVLWNNDKYGVIFILDRQNLKSKLDYVITNLVLSLIFFSIINLLKSTSDYIIIAYYSHLIFSIILSILYSYNRSKYDIKDRLSEFESNFVKTINNDQLNIHQIDSIISDFNEIHLFFEDHFNKKNPVVLSYLINTYISLFREVIANSSKIKSSSSASDYNRISKALWDNLIKIYRHAHLYKDNHFLSEEFATSLKILEIIIELDFLDEYKNFEHFLITSFNHNIQDTSEIVNLFSDLIKFQMNFNFDKSNIKWHHRIVNSCLNLLINNSMETQSKYFFKLIILYKNYLLNCARFLDDDNMKKEITKVYSQLNIICKSNTPILDLSILLSSLFDYYADKPHPELTDFLIKAFFSKFIVFDRFTSESANNFDILYLMNLVKKYKNYNNIVISEYVRRLESYSVAPEYKIEFFYMLSSQDIANKVISIESITLMNKIAISNASPALIGIMIDLINSYITKYHTYDEYMYQAVHEFYVISICYTLRNKKMSDYNFIKDKYFDIFKLIYQTNDSLDLLLDGIHDILVYNEEHSPDNYFTILMEIIQHFKESTYDKSIFSKIADIAFGICIDSIQSNREQCIFAFSNFIGWLIIYNLSLETPNYKNVKPLLEKASRVYNLCTKYGYSDHLLISLGTLFVIVGSLQFNEKHASFGETVDELIDTLDDNYKRILKISLDIKSNESTCWNEHFDCDALSIFEKFQNKYL